MSSVVAFSVFGVDWEFLKPYIVLGLALGGVYALSGVGIVVLYKATGVLNLAFGAVGAAGALIAYWMINHTSWPHWLAYATCVSFGGVVNLLYGVLFGPAFAKRDPLVKMMGTLALALILLGIMAWRAPAGGAFVRVLILPTSSHRYEIFGASVNLTQILSLVFALALTLVDDPFPALHVSRHRLSGGRQRPRDHGDARSTGSTRRGDGVVRLGPRLRRGGPAARRPLHLARLLRADVPRHLVAGRCAHRPPRVAVAHPARRHRRRLRSGRPHAVRLGHGVSRGHAVRPLHHRSALDGASARRRLRAGDALVDAAHAAKSERDGHDCRRSTGRPSSAAS